MAERRKYTRSTNSLHCVICHEYHQTSKNGKCKNIRADLPIFTEFLEENDPTFITTADSKTRTEQAIQRIIKVLQEHKQEFREWTTTCSDHVVHCTPKNVPLVENAPHLLSYEYLKSVDLIKII